MALSKFDASDRRGAGAVHHQFGFAQFAAGEMTGVDQAGGSHDGGAVLIVMEDRDVHELAKALLDDEAFRGLDVFEVNSRRSLVPRSGPR